MAYGGHDETDESLNAGKWKEFIKVMLRTNPIFQQLHSRLTQTYKIHDYKPKGPLIQLKKAMASEVRHMIQEQIEKEGMY